MISKIIMQKTQFKQESYVVDNIKLLIPNDWNYVNFCNGEEIQFFKENPLDEFPNIIEKFNSMPCQPHKADLFRYYYLYIYGGVFIDGDAMIYDNITNIIKDNSFVSVIGLDNTTLFNGFICTFPKNPILYKALEYAYNVERNNFMNNYDLLCKHLYKVVHNTNYNFKIKLYKEYTYHAGESAKTINDDGKIIVIHYYKYKIIPLKINTNMTTINIGPSKLPIKLVPLSSSFKNCNFILSKHNYNDNFTFEIYHNILIVKRIDSSCGWGHDHSVDIIEKK